MTDDVCQDQEEAAKRAAAAEEAKKRDAARAKLGRIMSGTMTPLLIQLTRDFGVDLVLNAMMDLSAGICSISFSEEQVPHYLHAMADRILSTDYQRHRARAFAGKLGLVRPGEERTSEGGIILPKGSKP